MSKAMHDIEKKSAIADLFIVVLDARAPLSTYNQDFDYLAPNKPRLFVISKVDLGDPGKLGKLISHFNHQKDAVLLVNLKKVNSYSKIMEKAESLLASKRAKEKAKGLAKPRLRAIVLGVPNVGKSTLINRLAKKAKTKVGNQPGITKAQQWINAGNIQLLDTPGILWPKISNELIGLKLAIIGSIKWSVLPQKQVFEQGYILLSKYYPHLIENLNLKPTNDLLEIDYNLVKLCQSKGFLLSKNNLDRNKAITFFIHYLRDLKGVTYD